jgi:hypothetical protein
VDRKIGLSVREYERDLDKNLIGAHGQSSTDTAAAAPTRSAPAALEAGKSMEDVAFEMMAAVRGADAARREEAAAAHAAKTEAAATVAEVATEAEVASEPEPEAAAVSEAVAEEVVVEEAGDAKQD